MKFDKSAENLIKFDKKLMEEPTKISSFWNFCQFRSEFEAFFITNCIYLFKDASLTMVSLLVKRFQLSKLASVSKI